MSPVDGAAGVALPFPDTLALPASARPIEQQRDRGRDWLLHRVLLIADVFGLSLAFVLGQLMFEPGGGVHDIVSPGMESAIFVLSLPVWVAIAVLSGLYGRDHTRTDHSTVDDLVGVFAVVTIGVWIFSCVIWFTHAASQNTPRMIAFWMMAIAFVVAARAVGRTIARRSPLFTQRAIMVGAGDVGQLIARKVKQHPEYGIELVGFVDSQPKERRRDIGDLRLLGSVDDLPALVDKLGVDRVVIAYSHDRHEHLLEIIHRLKARSIHIDLVPRLFEAVGTRVQMHSVEALPLIGLPPVQLSPSARFVKRAIDLIVAAVGLILTAPLFAYIAIRIKRDSPGPVLFRQARLGLNMKEFTALKFRTMPVDIDHSVHREYIESTMTSSAEVGDSGVYKLDRDGEVTKFGKWLRATSLDELPQLINVLKGDMSIVGPRPCIPYETEFFAPQHFERFLVPAGMTGLWQVTARARSTFGEALDMDVVYARSWSIGLDIRLLFRTPLAILRQEELDRVTDQRVHIGVLGLGYWGPNLVRNLYELPEAYVAYACDLDEDALSRIARRYPAVSRTTDYAELLEDPTVDAIAIATTVGTHHALAKRALEAGKHVFVEKPLAGSTEEAVELAELAAELGLVLMPGHTFLYSPPVNKIRELIQAGELGDIYSISTSRVNLGLHQPDVSVVWDLGPHDFSILRYWLDESPTQVMAMSRGCILPDIPDVAFVTLEFPSGAIANVELSWLAPSKLRRTTIIGSRKMVIYDDTSSEPVRIFDSGVMLPDPTTFGEYRLTYRTGDIVSPRIEVAEPLYLEMADFCRAVRTGSAPVSSVDLGIDVVRMIEAVDSSLDQNSGRVVVTSTDDTP